MGSTTSAVATRGSGVREWQAWYAASNRGAEALEGGFVGQLGAFGAGLDAAIGVFPHTVAHIPEVVERGLTGQVEAGDAALGRPVAPHDPDGEDPGPAVEVLD